MNFQTIWLTLTDLNFIAEVLKATQPLFLSVGTLITAQKSHTKLQISHHHHNHHQHHRPTRFHFLFLVPKPSDIIIIIIIIIASHHDALRKDGFTRLPVCLPLYAMPLAWHHDFGLPAAARAPYPHPRPVCAHRLSAPTACAQPLPVRPPM